MSQQLKSLIQPLKLERIDKIPSLSFIKEKYNVNPSTLLLLLFVILLLLSPIIHTHSLLTSIICYLIPAYLSFLALQSSDKDDDIRYLNYWVLFSIAEIFTPFLRLFFNKFIYMMFRIVITFLLLHPISDLSLKCYNGLVRPFLLKHQKRIDERVEDLANKGKKIVVDGIKEGIQKL